MNWRSLDDDREVSDSYVHRYPDAVYDSDDPEWREILADLDAEEDDDNADGDFSDESGGYDDRTIGGDFDDFPDGEGEDYWEVEIGIDYAPE